MKIILNYDTVSMNVTTDTGVIIGVMAETPQQANNLTLDLVKQGVTVDEIIKLKNSDLI